MVSFWRVINLKLVNYKTKAGVISGNIDEVLFIKDGKISSVNKKTTGPAIAGTRRTSNLQSTDDVVKLELDKEYEEAVSSGNIEFDDGKFLEGY